MSYNHLSLLNGKTSKSRQRYLSLPTFEGFFAKVKTE
jgi:hypothetical protein